VANQDLLSVDSVEAAEAVIEAEALAVAVVEVLLGEQIAE
jgi:hypothetical protein